MSCGFYNVITKHCFTTEKVLVIGECKTRDLGGNATTREMTRAILGQLEALEA